MNCPKCNAEVEEGVKVCPVCGETLVAEEPAPETEATAAEEVKAEEAKAEAPKEEAPKDEAKAEEDGAFVKWWKNFVATKDSTDKMEKKDMEDNLGITVLSYIWLLCLVPLLARKESAFAQYHAKRGLVLAIVETVVSVVLGVLGIIPYVGIVFTILASLSGLAFLGLSVIGIINVATSKARELPILGDLIKLD